MNDFKIIFYDKPDGTEPAKEFISSAEPKMRARLVQMIKLLSERGSELRMPYSEHLVDGIFELRAKVGSNISRALYFFVVGRKIVITNGFVKKRKKHQRVRLI